MIKIAEGLAILELIMGTPPGQSVMNLVLVWDDDTAVLPDTGLPGQLMLIQAEMEKAGVAFDRLKLVVITHQDTDHIGNIADLQNASGNLKVLSHMDEKPYIELEKKPIKWTQERYLQTCAQIGGGPKIDHALADGEELEACGGIRVIHTPGHTPGHICLYLKKYKTLVTGDAMNLVNGQLVGPSPQYTYNMAMAIDSLNKLKQFDIQTVICYHGGVFTGQVGQRLEELTSLPGAND